jgi:hypothetical protein
LQTVFILLKYVSNDLHPSKLVKMENGTGEELFTAVEDPISDTAVHVRIVRAHIRTGTASGSPLPHLHGSPTLGHWCCTALVLERTVVYSLALQLLEFLGAVDVLPKEPGVDGKSRLMVRPPPHPSPSVFARTFTQRAHAPQRCAYGRVALAAQACASRQVLGMDKSMSVAKRTSRKAKARPALRS